MRTLMRPLTIPLTASRRTLVHEGRMKKVQVRAILWYLPDKGPNTKVMRRAEGTEIFKAQRRRGARGVKNDKDELHYSCNNKFVFSKILIIRMTKEATTESNGESSLQDTIRSVAGVVKMYTLFNFKHWKIMLYNIWWHFKIFIFSSSRM